MSEAYKKAGVDIEAGYQAVNEIKAHVKKTHRPEVLSMLGSFAGLFELPVDRYQQPVLVSGTDGVGTKLKLAFSLDKHDTIGIDLVAMCVNDVLVHGAQPLFFLDYLATSKVEAKKVGQVVAGIAEGCVQAGCALIGGETAEMPGFYTAGEYDLAGFCVGVVEKNKIINGSAITPGDVILGLPSSGIHSNGFSLVRRIISDHNCDLEQEFDQGRTLGEVLLAPTKIYVKSIQAVLDSHPIAGMAHITGGGFVENIPRILPEDCDAIIELGSWPQAKVFDWLRELGGLTQEDLFNTFNMGIGMVIVVKADVAQEVAKILAAQNEPVFQIGMIAPGTKQVVLKEENE